jgi:potassium-dependent mechanosensitive channel
MDLEPFLRLFDKRLFHWGTGWITSSELLLAALTIAVTLFVSRTLRHVAQAALDRRGQQRVPATLAGFLHYLTLIVGFGLALSFLGVNLKGLFAAGAIFAIGLGFAMQSIAQNFVAGVLLLVERTIKPGDVIEVDNKIVMVREMGIRSSLVRTRDGEDIIIPNATLISNQVKNFTMSSMDYRIRVQINISYKADMALVRKVLGLAAAEFSRTWGKGEEGLVLLVEFGAHAVVWEVGCWIKDPWERRVATSDLLEQIWWALKAEGVEIAYPQMDVHLDADALSALKGDLPKPSDIHG